MIIIGPILILLFVAGITSIFTIPDNNKDNNPFFNWEKKETKKGNYKPFNFEEEELEDDDYYNEDID